MSNNNIKPFVIAIGGTGMRCLESFVHLCALGMFDNKEVNILTLDTDKENGNRLRVENLIDTYAKVKGDAAATSNAFFTAKISRYSYYTIYDNKKGRNYIDLANATSSANKQDNEDLSDLFFEKETVQKFDLTHGYRAQTHLGSYLMYHSIVESAISYNTDKKKCDKVDENLHDFLKKLSEADKDARVFVFGSVFGGTGASSIPVLPQALKDAVRILFGGKQLEAKFASTLLTNYFTFKDPSSEDVKANKVFAMSKFFALNSQAAMDFYSKDDAVRRFYTRFYMVGWPETATDVNGDKAKGGSDTETGGDKQKNKCHICELLCAVAAWDFFGLDENAVNNESVAYYYHALPHDGKAFEVEGRSLFGESDGDVFTRKIAAMLGLRHMSLTDNGLQGLYDNIKNHSSEAERNMYDGLETKGINEYLNKFAYELNSDCSLKEYGWLYQVASSLGDGTFIFKKDAVSDNFKKIDAGNLFDENKNSENKKYNWHSGGIFSKGTVDKFVDVLCKSGVPKDADAMTVTERFLTRIYRTFMDSLFKG